MLTAGRPRAWSASHDHLGPRPVGLLRSEGLQRVRMATIRSPIAPLIERLSNGHFGLKIAKLLSIGSESALAHTKSSLCGCGCGQPTAAGRKFVSQGHYDRSKGLSPSWLRCHLQMGSRRPAAWSVARGPDLSSRLSAVPY
jgi:hypothetical protein